MISGWQRKWSTKPKRRATARSASDCVDTCASACTRYGASCSASDSSLQARNKRASSSAPSSITGASWCTSPMIRADSARTSAETACAGWHWPASSITSRATLASSAEKQLPSESRVEPKMLNKRHSQRAASASLRNSGRSERSCSTVRSAVATALLSSAACWAAHASRTATAASNSARESGS